MILAEGRKEVKNRVRQEILWSFRGQPNESDWEGPGVWGLWDILGLGVFGTFVMGGSIEGLLSGLLAQSQQGNWIAAVAWAIVTTLMHVWTGVFHRNAQTGRWKIVKMNGLRAPPERFKVFVLPLMIAL